MKASKRNLYIKKFSRLWISVLLVLSLSVTFLPCDSAFAVEDQGQLDDQIDNTFIPEENGTATFVEESDEQETEQITDDPEPEVVNPEQEVTEPGPVTVEPEQETSNPEPEGTNQNPETENPESEVTAPESETTDTEPEVLDSEQENTDSESIVIDPESEVTNPEPVIIDPEPEITDPEEEENLTEEPEKEEPEEVEEKETVLLTLDGRVVEEFSINSDYFINPVYYHTADEYAELWEATAEDDIFIGVQAELSALDPSGVKTAGSVFRTTIYYNFFCSRGQRLLFGCIRV